ncbi:kinase-like protein [Neurospora intermedia]|uniref:Kinase-like protein n=1 Tax=Neurospora intermedia TaxID=5142 RepID=A0ABR3DSM1_NEUIN
MNDMSSISPTPMGGGSHFTSMGRRTSARQALRRPPSRPMLNRNESNPQSQSQQYSNLNDSSDDEIPVPMKLSALTKALLNDGHASEASSFAQHGAPEDLQLSPPARPPSRVTRRSALLSSKSEERSEGVRAREARRSIRGGSLQPMDRPTSPVQNDSSNNRDGSPVPRKRVVRLSNPVQGPVSFSGNVRRLSSTTANQRRTRTESREREVEKEIPSFLQQQGDAGSDSAGDAQTPVIRTVRIAVSSGSSGSKGRISLGGGGGSSGSSFAGVSGKRGTGYSDHENPEDPATIGRPQTVAPQSSMRIKRVAKVPGSFLSGPARRGRRRQSDEDEAAHGENEAMGMNQDNDGNYESHMQSHVEAAMGEQHLSFYGSNNNYRDYAASGSPVSGKAGAVRRRESNFRAMERDNGELGYNIAEPHPDMPMNNDKENEAPPTFKRAKLTPSSMLDHEIPKPVIPEPMALDIGRDIGRDLKRLSISPDRKALAHKSQNTPHRPAPPPPPKMSVVETATAAAGASATAGAAKKRQVLLRVNGRTYTRIDCIGRGGSGKVYRVSAESGKMLALKRVSLEHADENTVKGFKGEIDLLKRLNGVERVIQLIDHELNLEKQVLSVLMEVGELDFNTLLKSRQSTAEGARLDPTFIRYYWKEMLECVQAVHARDVVHSDLKPANFVLVQGRLKLIDFGIANAIQTEMTVNVHRETQIGTPNYMSPESLMDSNQYAFTSAQNGKFCIPPPLNHRQHGAPKLMKLGKPSDVWSLGCILYQMVYGLPPFGKIANQMSRCQAIINWSYQIDFPEATEDGSRVPPSVIRTMRRCLNREQRERPTCDELLADTDPFLYPQEFDPSVYAAAEHGRVLPVTEELLSRLIQSVVQRCKERMPTEAEVVNTWPQAYWATVRKAVMGAGNNAGGSGGGSGGGGHQR